MSDFNPPTTPTEQEPVDDIKPDVKPPSPPDGGGKSIFGKDEESRRKREKWIALGLELAILFIIAMVLALYLQAFVIKHGADLTGG
jgi:hypothetical protein